jgi:predicted amidophosphoribosyltransferase
MIARGLSEVTALPVSTGNLVRVIFNPTQTKRTKTQRWENVKGIFEVVDSSLFEGKHLLLVDDVITTGSTIEACGLALQACKGVKISIATLGQVL